MNKFKLEQKNIRFKPLKNTRSNEPSLSDISSNYKKWRKDKRGRLTQEV